LGEDVEGGVIKAGDADEDEEEGVLSVVLLFFWGERAGCCPFKA